MSSDGDHPHPVDKTGATTSQGDVDVELGHGHSHSGKNGHDHSHGEGSSGHGHSHGEGSSGHGHSHGEGSSGHGHSHGSSPKKVTIDAPASPSVPKKIVIDIPGPSTPSPPTKHCHDDLLDQIDTSAVSRRKLIVACVLCVTFMAAEIVGGLLSSSLAIMTDALHLLTDLVGFGISVAAITLARRPATRNLTFGWYRAEVLGALISVLLVWAITAILVFMAIERIVSNSYEIDAQIMLITSSLGVVINLLMGIQLQHGGGGHGHSHGFGGGHSHGGGAKSKGGHGHAHGGHGHSHGNGKPKSNYGSMGQASASKAEPNPEKLGRRRSSESDLAAAGAHGGEAHDRAVSSGMIAHELSQSSQAELLHNDYASESSRLETFSYTSEDEHNHSHDEGGNEAAAEQDMNVRAAVIHILGDLGQSVGVMIAALIIYFRPELKVADPICTFIFSVVVLFTTITIMRDVFHILMEGAPRNIDYGKMEHDLLKIHGVKSVHNLRIWALTVSKIAASAHIGFSEAQCEQGPNHMTYDDVLEKARKVLQKKYGIADLTLQVEQHTDAMDNCGKCQPPAGEQK